MTISPAIDAVVELTRLSTWLTVNGFGDGGIEDPTLLTGGTQNVLLRFRLDGRDVVLRRPPLRPRPKNNDLILREARVLNALADTPVPHPRVLAVCADPTVLDGAVFYLMDAVDGFNPASELPDPLNSPDGRRHLTDEATDALAQIGELDHEAIGLADFGNPAGFLERQVPRWVAERDRFLGLDGYDGAALPGFEAVRDHLAATVPPSFRPGLTHGDYHFGNLLFDATTAKLAAVLDWEMSTIGDPLLDLGRFLAMMPDEHEVVVPPTGIWDGELPHPDTIVHRYSERTGRPVEHLPWYVGMGCFKLGIILESTYARSCAGLAPKAVGLTLHEAAIQLFHRATRLIGAK